MNIFHRVSWTSVIESQHRYRVIIVNCSSFCFVQFESTAISMKIRRSFMLNSVSDNQIFVERSSMQSNRCTFERFFLLCNDTNRREKSMDGFDLNVCLAIGDKNKSYLNRKKWNDPKQSWMEAHNQTVAGAHLEFIRILITIQLMFPTWPHRIEESHDRFTCVRPMTRVPICEDTNFGQLLVLRVMSQLRPINRPRTRSEI